MVFASQDRHQDWRNFFALETLPSTVCLVGRPWPALLPAETNDVNFFASGASLLNLFTLIKRGDIALSTDMNKFNILHVVVVLHDCEVPPLKRTSADF
jgi:hypothetical protein